jgi:hypothetical protein
MDGWMDLWSHDRAGELRLEAEERRLVSELKAARTKRRGRGVSHLLRGLRHGIAGLAPRTVVPADAGAGCAEEPETAR